MSSRGSSRRRTPGSSARDRRPPAQQVEVADDVGGVHVLGDPLAAVQAQVRKRRVPVVERPVLVVLVRNTGTPEKKKALSSSSLSKQCSGSQMRDPARVEADDVEAPVEVVVQELAKPLRTKPTPDPPGPPGSMNTLPKRFAGRSPHAGQQHPRLLPPGRVVVERHLDQRTLRAGKSSPHGCQSIDGTCAHRRRLRQPARPRVPRAGQRPRREQPPPTHMDQSCKMHLPGLVRAANLQPSDVRLEVENRVFLVCV